MMPGKLEVTQIKGKTKRRGSREGERQREVREGSVSTNSGSLGPLSEAQENTELRPHSHSSVPEKTFMGSLCTVLWYSMCWSDHSV